MQMRWRSETCHRRPAIARSDEPPPEIRTADYRPERDGVFEVRPLSNEAAPEADASSTDTSPDAPKAATLAPAIYTAYDAEKLKLVAALREIIENGKVTGTEAARAGRTDGIVKVHWVVADVTLEGKTRPVAINVGEDARGKKFYNLNPDAGDFAKSAPPGTIVPAIPGTGINLFFLDGESSKAGGDEKQGPLRRR